MDIFYTPKFLRVYKKLLDEIKDKVESKEKLIKNDLFNKALKTHKLHGDFEGFYAFSIDYKIRIIFELSENNTAIFHDIGSHDIYE